MARWIRPSFAGAVRPVLAERVFRCAVDGYAIRANRGSCVCSYRGRAGRPFVQDAAEEVKLRAKSRIQGRSVVRAAFFVSG